MEKLALEVFDLVGNGSQFANLPSNTSITVTKTSAIFDSGDVWTHSFALNVFANAHIFGAAGDMHGNHLHEQVDNRRARLWVMGIPMYYGYLKLGEEVDVDGSGDVDISFESGKKTFDEMIDGVYANQVPIPDDILLGMAVKRERTVDRVNAKLRVYSTLIDWFWGHPYLEYPVSLKGIKDFAQQWPKYVRPDGEWKKADDSSVTESIPKMSTVNTDYPYDDAHPYCNTRLCYQKQIYKTPDGGGDPEKKAVHEAKVSEARRVNPAPNFYVLYWLKILMQHLNIHIEENQMLGVSDLKRLFFVNTKCGYKTPDETLYIDNHSTTNLKQGPGNPFVPFDEDDRPAWEFKAEFVSGPGYLNYDKFSISKQHEQRHGVWGEFFYFLPDPNGSEVREKITLGSIGTSIAEAVRWQKAYASSENFPNVEIKEVIEAIENGFGVRFLFNDDYTKVRIVLLRNILRSQEVQEIECEVLETTKEENCIRGFRLTYGGSEDDTSYHYKGFEQARQKNELNWLTEEDEHDYSQFNIELGYDKIKDEVRMLNKTCYVDSATGNAYVIKVDQDAKNAADEYYPSLFECFQFSDAEDGDCSGEEETIEEIQVGFSPMVENAIKTDNTYALLVNEEMGVGSETETIDMLESEARNRIKVTSNTAGCTTVANNAEALTGLFEVATATTVDVVGQDGTNIFLVNLNRQDWGMNYTYAIKVTGYIRDGYRLLLDDNYDINDEMESPIEKHDWGLTLGIMRGSGRGTTGPLVNYQEDIIENEGNDTWDLTQGATATAHSDSCDDYGKRWYYGSMQVMTGTAYGTKILTDAGVQYPENFRKGPTAIEIGTDTTLSNAYNSYFAPDKGYQFQLFGVTDQGYYVMVSDIDCRDGKHYGMVLSCVGDNTLKTYGDMKAYIEILKYNGASAVDSNLPQNLADLFARDTSHMIVSAKEDGTTPGEVLITAAYALLKGDDDVYYGPDEDTDEDTDGMVSLKLRAEKPNPYFDPTQPENDTTNRRYLEITTPSLRKRGLADKFYKEYSYLIRNCRIANQKVRMELAQFTAIDDTKKATIGDITGFIKKIQFTVNIQTGIDTFDVKMLYI